MSFSWYPLVDNQRCSGCSVCYDFCPHDVYEWDVSKEKPLVVKPENCIHNCHGCEDKCPAQAIKYHGDLPGRIAGGAYRLKL
ncbi:MAG: ferredoxin family protein [Syntrophomonadaceae bacterium]|nr:ferredoxin family protein [Syntrophomonadaceae bacterium]